MEAHYALVFYPNLESEALDELRREHDPTVELVRPHVTVVFPVPEEVGERQLVDHIEAILASKGPFEIRFVTPSSPGSSRCPPMQSGRSYWLIW